MANRLATESAKWLGDGESQRLQPHAPDRSNWLFAGPLRNGQRAAAIMNLIQSARMNGHDPYAYLKDMIAGRIRTASTSI
jgi:transposase